jgi:hypothetical protein
LAARRSLRDVTSACCFLYVVRVVEGASHAAIGSTLVGKQQPGAIIPKRPLSASVLKGTRQAVKIALESPLIVTQDDIVTHHPDIGASKLRQNRPVPEISIKL